MNKLSANVIDETNKIISSDDNDDNKGPKKLSN